MRWPWLAGGALFAVLLCGCFGQICHVPVDAATISADAPSEGGPGDRTVAIHVHEDAPNDRQRVYVLWPREGGFPDVNDTSSHITLRAMGLRASGGLVIAHVPSDRPLRILASGSAETMEALVAEVIPASRDPLDMDVWLLRQGMKGELQGNWSQHSAVPFVSPYTNVAWDPQQMRFHANATWNGIYTQAISHVEAQLDWENGLNGQATFGIAMDATGGDADNCSFQDHGDETGKVGPQHETFDSDKTGEGTFCVEAGQGGVPHAPKQLFIGPASPGLAVGALALPYHIRYNATFGFSSTAYQPCSVAGDSTYTIEYVDPRSGRVTESGAPRGNAPAASVGFLLALLGLAASARRR